MIRNCAITIRSNWSSKIFECGDKSLKYDVRGCSNIVRLFSPSKRIENNAELKIDEDYVEDFYDFVIGAQVRHQEFQNFDPLR